MLEAPAERPAATTETIVRAIISRQPKGVSQTRLLKLFYLAETKYMAETGKRLTDADFFRYDQGPYSKDVVNTARSLSPEIVIGREQAVSPDYEGVFFSPGPSCSPDLSEEISGFIHSLMGIYGREKTDAIVGAAYRSAAFLAAGDRQDIGFARWGASVEDFRKSSAIETAIREAVDREPIFQCESLKELTEYLEALRTRRGGPQGAH